MTAAGPAGRRDSTGPGALPAQSRIAGAAAILLAGFVVSRLMGVAREVLLGARFGTSDDYDLYLAAFRIPDLIFTLVAGGALGSALIPVFADYLATRQAEGVSRLASRVFNLVAIAGGTAALLGMVLAPQAVRVLWPADLAQQGRLASLVRVMLLQPVFFGLGEVVMRYLNVRQHFLFPAFAPTIYNMCIIAGALFLGPSLGTFGLAIGVSAGALAYFLVQLPAAWRRDFRWRPELDLADPGLRQVAGLMLPRLIGQGAVQFSFVATTRLASYLPEGRLAALNFAWILTMLPLGTLAGSLANAAFPTLSAQAARGDQEAFAATSRRTLGTILFLMVPSALGLITLALPLVQAVYQRRAFTAESSVLTAAALVAYAIGLPAHGALEILARSFFALHDTRTPVAVSVGGMIATIALATASSGSPLGHVGIALAVTASTTVEALALGALLARRVPGLLARELARSFGQTALAGAALAAAALGAAALARSLGLPALVQSAAGAAAGGGAYLAMAVILGAPDLEVIIARIRRRQPDR